MANGPLACGIHATDKFEAFGTTTPVSAYPGGPPSPSPPRRRPACLCVRVRPYACVPMRTCLRTGRSTRSLRHALRCAAGIYSESALLPIPNHILSIIGWGTDPAHGAYWVGPGFSAPL
jgi:hypothetical protein